MTPEELTRFMSHIEVVDGHWLWTNCLTNLGYGKIQINGKTKLAHRVMLAHSLGRELLPGLVACHAPVVCHIRHCCNPDHLREDTEISNAADKILDGTHSIGSANGRAKLTDADIPVIRTDSRSLREIAADYGVTFALIGQIKNKKVWSHIE